MKKRLNNSIVALLKQGVTPQKLALTFTIGLVLGTFPAIGLTTILCTLAAMFLRLNMPAMQLVNYLVYPLQLVLMVPFAELGASFLNSTITLFPMAEIDVFSQEGIALLWDNLSEIFGSAALAWAVIMAPVSVLFYYASFRFFKNLSFLQKLANSSENVN